MNFETRIPMTPADEVAAEAVRGLTNINLGCAKELVVQSIAAKAKGNANALIEARRLAWILALETKTDFQYFARVYTDGKPLARGSVVSVQELLLESEKRIRM